MPDIPDFDDNGNLPPGVFKVSLNDIEERLTWNIKRKKLFKGLKRAIENLKKAKVRRVWIDGSFVTRKTLPNDIDGCWEYDPEVVVDFLDPVILDMNPPRAAMKEKFGIDFLISGAPLLDIPGKTVESFFQTDRNGNDKGVLLLEIG